jgi:hypothetical protein
VERRDKAAILLCFWVDNLPGSTPGASTNLLSVGCWPATRVPRRPPSAFAAGGAVRRLCRTIPLRGILHQRSTPSGSPGSESVPLPCPPLSRVRKCSTALPPTLPAPPTKQLFNDLDGLTPHHHIARKGAAQHVISNPYNSFWTLHHNAHSAIRAVVQIIFLDR